MSNDTLKRLLDPYQPYGAASPEQLRELISRQSRRSARRLALRMFALQVAAVTS